MTHIEVVQDLCSMRKDDEAKWVKARFFCPAMNSGNALCDDFLSFVTSMVELLEVASNSRGMLKFENLEAQLFKIKRRPTLICKFGG